MPFNSDTKLFGRVWKFVDQFVSGDDVRRLDLDTALDDISVGLNDTSIYLRGLITTLENSELYLGASAEAPETGIGGLALVPGNFYAKTPDFIFFVFNGSDWVSTSDLPPASDFFKTLVGATNSEEFRGLIELGSSATRNAEYFATANRATNLESAITAAVQRISAIEVSLQNGGGVPVGEVMFTAMSIPPSGFLKANGAEYSREEYSVLFSKIGTIYGNGDGSTTFNVPDIRGRFVRAWDDERGLDDGRVFGSNQGDTNKSHSHDLTFRIGNSDTARASDITDGGTGNSGHPMTTEESGSTESRPKNIALLACIKY